jgi:hypothetical protein
VGSQKLLSVTHTIASYTSTHARGCVRRASGLVLTRNPEAWPADFSVSDNTWCPLGQVST